ncbi:MAG: lytic transglycosylase domain-containing protein [Roseivivax sp.]|nr:lytic transglycosylase domain-containing protein [Roseivivax sp.]
MNYPIPIRAPMGGSWASGLRFVKQSAVSQSARQQEIGRMLRAVLAMMACLVSQAAAGTETSRICDDVAIRAAQQELIPQNVMLAVTRLETGRTYQGVVRPWPWTVNVAGVGRYFDSRESLRAYLTKITEEGSTNFDSGCFQINYRWHGDAFASLDEMIDPMANAVYAAQFLRSLFEETGDWTMAVGHYHSRTAVHADRYKRKYAELQRSLQAGLPEALPVMPRRAPRENTYALLQPGAAPHVNGSLVPLDLQVAVSLLGQ